MEGNPPKKWAGLEGDAPPATKAPRSKTSKWAGLDAPEEPPFAAAPPPQQPPVLGGGGGAAPTGSGMQSAPSQPPIAPGGITNVTERLRFTSGEDEMGDAVLMSPVKTGLIRSPEQKAMMSAHDKFDGFDLPKIAKYREEKIAVGKQQLRGIKLVTETDAKQLEESANTLEKMKAEVEVSPTPEAVAAYNAAVSRHNSDVNLFTKQQQALQDAAMSLDVEQNELFRREYDIKSKQGSFVGATRNELLAGVGDLLGGLETAIAFGVVSQLPVGAEGVLGGKSGERDQLFKDIRRRVIGPMSNVPGEELGDKGTTPEYSEEMRKEFLGGAWLGLARSAPAMATPYMSGIALQTMKSTMEEMDAPEFADISEAEKFAISVPIGAVSAALERFGFKNLASNKAVVKTVLANGLRKLSAEAGVEEISRVMNMEARNFATRYVAAAATGAAAEFETGAIQELSTNVIKEAYNAARDGDRFRTPDGWMGYLGETFKAGAQEAVGGFIMAQPFAVSQAMRKGEVGKVATPKQFEMVEELAVDPNYDAMFKEQQAQDVEDGKLTKEQAEQVTQDWETAKRIIEKTPDDLPVGSRMKAFDLLSQMEGLRKKEPALVANKMEALKQQLQALEGVPETPEATVDAEGKKGKEPPPVQPTGKEAQQQSLISAEGATTPDVVSRIDKRKAELLEYLSDDDRYLADKITDPKRRDRFIEQRAYSAPAIEGKGKVIRKGGQSLRDVHKAEDALTDPSSSAIRRAAARYSIENGGLDLTLVESDLQKLLGERAGTIFPSSGRVHELYNEELSAEGAVTPEAVTEVQPTVVEDASATVVERDPEIAPAGVAAVADGDAQGNVAETPPLPPQAPPSVPVQERPVSDLYVKPDLSRDVADDPIALASAYMDDHITHSDGSTLDDHIGTLVGNNVNRASFEKFGDVSNITKDMKRAYLREEGGRELDDLAEELTGIWGETVTPEQIVDYIIRNPTGRQAVSPRAREIASRYYGITGKRMNSLTAKMILGMNKDDDGNPIPAKRVKWKPAEQAIVDAALAAQVDLSEINDDDIADAKNMEDDDLMDMFGPSRKGKTTTATEDKRKKDEEAKQAQPAGADGTGGEVRRAESPRPPRAADPEEERLAEALKTARAERDAFVNDFNDRGQGLFAPEDIPTRQQTIDDTIDNSKENFDAKVEPLNERVRQAAKALADYVEKGAARAEAAAKQTAIPDAPAKAEAPLPKKEERPSVSFKRPSPKPVKEPTVLRDVPSSVETKEYAIQGFEEYPVVVFKDKGGWKAVLRVGGLDMEIAGGQPTHGIAAGVAHEKMSRAGKKKLDDLVEKNIKEQESLADRIEQAADELEKKLRGMAGSFPVPPTIIVSAMRAAAKVIRAGESLAKAIRAAIEDMQASKWWKALSPSDQGKAEREVREQLRVALEPREPKASKPSEVKKAVQQSTGTKSEKSIVEVDEKAALRDQIRLEIKAAVDGGKEVARKVSAVMEKFKTKLSPAQVSAITRAASRAVTPATSRRFIQYADRIIANSEQAAKEKEARDIAKRIKRLVRGKADERRDAMVNDLAGEFAKLNIANVDIDEYLDKAKRLLDTLSSPKAKSAPEVVTAKDTETNISNAELSDYINKQRAIQDVAADMAAREDLNDLLESKGVDADSLTPEEMDVLLNALRGEQQQIDAANTIIANEQKLEMLRTMARLKMAELDAAIKNREEPLDKDEQEMVDDLRDIDIATLGGDKAAFLITAINNIIINDRWGGVRDFGAIGRRDRFFRNVPSIFKGIKNIGRPGKEQKQWGLFNATDTVDIMAEKIARGPTAAAKFLRGIGMHGLINALSSGKRNLDAVRKSRQELFKKLKWNKWRDDTVLNRFRMGAYAELIQHKGGTPEQVQAQFDQRAKNLRDSVENMRNPNKIADLGEIEPFYIQAVEEVLGEAKNSDELTIDPRLRTIVHNEIRERQKIKDETFSAAERDHNLAPRPYENYTPVRSFPTTAQKKQDVQRDMFEAKPWGSKLIDSEASSSKLDRSDTLPLGHAIDLDFFAVQDESFFETVADNLGARHLATLRETLNDPRMEELLGADTVNLLRARAREIKGLEETKGDLIGNAINNVAYKIAKRSARIAMAGVAQLAKQGTVGLSTAVALGPKNIDLLFPSYADAWHAFNNEEGSWQYELIKDEQIHERAKTLAGTEKLGDVIAKKAVLEGDEGDMSRIYKVVSHELGLISDKGMYTMAVGDALSAQASWFAFYKQKLRQKGVDLNEEGWKKQKDEEAASYANQMVSRQQNANTAESMASIYRDKNKRWLIEFLYSFSSFALNTRKRIARDVQNIRHGSKEDRAYSWMDLVVGVPLETLAYQSINAALFVGGVQLAELLADAIAGDDGEDEELPKAKDVVTDIAARTASDLLLGGFPDLIGNPIKEGANEAAKSIANHYGTQVRTDGKDLYYVPRGMSAGQYGAILGEAANLMKGLENYDEPEGLWLTAMSALHIGFWSDQQITKPFAKELRNRLKETSSGSSRRRGTERSGRPGRPSR